MRRTLLGVAVSAALLSVPIGPAQAGTSYLTAAALTYLPGEVTIAPGDSLQFFNADVAPHNVVSTALTGGEPLFASDTAGPLGLVAVEGVEDLGIGTYAFFCSVHPNMRGAVLVR